MLPKHFTKFHRARLHRFDGHGNIPVTGDENNGDLSSGLV
jgi:hypothetical protein